jgi:hypothetical protein
MDDANPELALSVTEAEDVRGDSWYLRRQPDWLTAPAWNPDERIEESKMTERKSRLARIITAMPVILRNVPSGFNWGWYSREDPRMHLQVVDPRSPKENYKVWLETRGRRTVEPATQIKGGVLRAITAEIMKHRQYIEDHWVRFMIDNGWIQLHLKAPVVTVVAYPNTPNKFTRNVDLTQYFLKELVMNLTEKDVTLSREMASLRVFDQRPEEEEKQDIRLSTILWTDV